MKTVCKISLDGGLKKLAQELSQVFFGRTFISYYQSKKAGVEIPGTDRMCLVQNLPMDEIRRESPEFSVLRTTKDANENEYKIGFGITLSENLKFYKDCASGILGHQNLKSLPLAAQLLEELADDVLVKNYLLNFSSSRLLLNKLRKNLGELYANHGRHFIPISYKFFKSDSSKLMRLCLVEGDRLHELHIRQANGDTYRVDFRVKDYRVVSRDEYYKKRGPGKGYGVYLPVMGSFDEDPLLESEVMATFAEAKDYLLPRLAFMMEEHLGNSGQDCIDSIRAQIESLKTSEFTSANYFNKIKDDKSYDHFFIDRTNECAGNLIFVQKLRPSPADKYVPKQLAAKNLRAVLSKLQDEGDIKIQLNEWLPGNLLQIEWFNNKTIFTDLLTRPMHSRGIDYPMSEAADAVLSLARGKPALVYCSKENKFIYTAHKFIALGQGTITQMSRKNKLPQDSLVQTKEDDFFRSTIRSRMTLKEASVAIENAFQARQYDLDPKDRYMDLDEMDTGLSPKNVVTFLVPIGKPGQPYSGVLALSSTVKDYYYGGGFKLDVISCGQNIPQFQNRLRAFMSQLDPSSQGHYAFFNASQRFSASWGIEAALDTIPSLVYGFLPSAKDSLALIAPAGQPNHELKEGKYTFSMDMGRLLVILDTTVPPAAKKGQKVDRYSYQSWEIQTDTHFDRHQLNKLKYAFILTHYKSAYLTSKLPLGAQTTVKLLRKLKEVVEYPMDVARNAELAPYPQSKNDSFLKASENSRLGPIFDEHLSAVNRLREQLLRAHADAPDTLKKQQIIERAEPIKELRNFVTKFASSADGDDLEQTPGVKVLRAFMQKQGLKRLPLGIFG